MTESLKVETDTITIDPRFCGPPAMANGGYVAGLLAQRLVGPVKVSLRRPIPLNQPLTIEADTQHRVKLTAGDEMLAEAEEVAFEFDLPQPPTYAEAQAVTGKHPLLDRHPFPNCFVCGPKRVDGLHILPGSIGNGQMVASTWSPDVGLADETGRVGSEFVWAALDCPGGAAAVHLNPRPIVLAQFMVQIEAQPRCGDPCIVIGWEVGHDRHKHFVGSALFSLSGEPLAYAQATWIEVRLDGNGVTRT